MEVVNMVKKSKVDFVFELEQNSNSGKSDFSPAHQLSKSKLKKNTKNKPVSKPNPNVIKTGHRTPNTEHLKIKNGPEGNRTPGLYRVKVASYHSTTGPQGVLLAGNSFKPRAYCPAGGE